jgi:hypothetical protein
LASAIDRIAARQPTRPNLDPSQRRVLERAEADPAALQDERLEPRHRLPHLGERPDLGPRDLDLVGKFEIADVQQLEARRPTPRQHVEQLLIFAVGILPIEADHQLAQHATRRMREHEIEHALERKDPAALVGEIVERQPRALDESEAPGERLGRPLLPGRVAIERVAIGLQRTEQRRRVLLDPALGRRPLPRAHERDQLAARVADALQPISVDKKSLRIVGRGEDRLEELAVLAARRDLDRRLAALEAVGALLSLQVVVRLRRLPRLVERLFAARPRLADRSGPKEQRLFALLGDLPEALRLRVLVAQPARQRARAIGIAHPRRRPPTDERVALLQLLGDEPIVLLLRRRRARQLLGQRLAVRSDAPPARRERFSV